MPKNPLFEKNFFLLWSGTLISKIGDKFYAIALAWWILEKTKSPAMMGLMLIASVLPGLLIGPFAGTLIDQWPRKPILVWADILRGGAVLAVSVLSTLGILEIWQILLAAVFISLGSAFFDPAFQTVIPQIVKDEQLPKANALQQMVGGISIVFGPILGSIAVSIFGFTTVFLWNAVSYFVSAFCESLIAIPVVSGARRQETKYFDDLKEGFQYLKQQRKLMIIMVVIGIAHFFVGGLMVILPFLANKLAGKGVQNLGYLETMLGAGLILASFYINLKKKSMIRERNLFLFMTFVGLCFIGIGLIQINHLLMIVPYMAIIAVVGACIANASVYWQSLLQSNIPNRIAGRVFSISTMVANISMPVAYGLYGYLLNRFTVAGLMLVSGVCLAITSLILMSNYSIDRELNPDQSSFCP